MLKIATRLLFIATMTLILAAGAFAATSKQVYLKDGGIIEAESAWKKGSTVFVKVNRDTLVELTQDEVDLQKTFGPVKKPVAKKKPAKKPVSAIKPKKAAAAEEKTVAEEKPAGKPAAKPAPVAAAKPTATPPQPQKAQAPPAPAKPPAQPAPAKPAPPQAAPAQPTAPTVAPQTAPATPEPMPKPQVRQPMPSRSTPPAPLAPSPAAAAEAPSLGMVPLIIIAAILLFFIATFWKLYEKAGEAGWTCLIPIYNTIVFLRIAGKPWWWLVLLLIPILNIIISLLLSLAIAQKFGKSQLFGLGLFFLGIILYPVLAFGSAEYEG